MNSPHRSIAVLAVVLAAGLVACEPNNSVPAGCSSTANCPFGEVCDPLANACVPEPLDGITGRFSCPLVEAGTPVPDLGASEVIARFMEPASDGSGLLENRWALIHSVTCSHIAQDGADYLALSFAEFDGLFTHSFFLVFPWEAVAAGGDAYLPSTYRASSIPSGVLSSYSDAEEYTHAYAEQLVLRINAPVVGQRLEGFVLGGLDDIQEQNAVGFPCSSVADCGWDARLYCLAYEEASGPRQTCTAFCDEVDCGVFGGVCSDGYCLQPCTSHDQCTPPLECYQAGTPGDPSACW